MDYIPNTLKMVRKSHPNGTVYLSTGKFTYDMIRPKDKDYPLNDFEVQGLTYYN